MALVSVPLVSMALVSVVLMLSVFKELSFKLKTSAVVDIKSCFLSRLQFIGVKVLQFRCSCSSSKRP